MVKVLLLNPPASKRYVRDYYCGEQSKGRYIYPPTDLLVLSGIIGSRHEIEVLDAMVEGLNLQEADSRIRIARPDAIVSLASSASWQEDSAFFDAVRSHSDAPILLTGDLPRAAPDKVLSWCGAVTGVITDFTDCDAVDFVDGRRRDLVNIHTREGPALPSPRRNAFAYPAPRHEAFPLELYHHPLMSCHPYTTLLTDFSCPHRCTFCPYERIHYKTRDLDNVRAELERVRDLGVRSLLVNDASFGADRGRGRTLCRLIGESGVRWICGMRVDDADEALLAAMKEAGCELVMFGVETPSPDVLGRIRKGITADQAVGAFASARSAGLRTLAHFIIGLDGENEPSQERLIDFALELDPDYASFGVAVPAWDTTFRDELVDKGAVDPDAYGFDVSADRPLWDSEHLDRSQVERIRRAAMRRFYLRPSYILRRLFSIRTAYEARNLVVQGLYLVGWR